MSVDEAFLLPEDAKAKILKKNLENPADSRRIHPTLAVLEVLDLDSFQSSPQSKVFPASFPNKFE